MANKSIITYIKPKDRFVMVGKGIVSKFSPEVVGTYCKIIQLSGGTSLSIPFIADKIKVGVKKVRKVIVILEEAGYVVRKPIKDEKGAFSGWNYCVYAEPVSKNERSRAGMKSDLTDNGVDQERTYPKTDKSETGKENILLSNTDVLSNNEDLDYNKEKKRLSNDNQKEEIFFEDFYKIYPLKKSRRDAEKAWGKLSLKDKKEAIKRLPAYIADCLSHNRSYQYPARYINAGTWNDQFDDDETGEMKEDDTPTLLPPGMTQEQWEKVSAWMVVYIKHIAGKITPIMLAQMKKDVNGNSSLLSDILVDLDERLMDLCNYDVYNEFKKLLKEDEYQQQL